MPRLGILGGAFNPPHLGHLICAQEAFVQLELDEVRLVPVGEAPHREIELDPGAEARAEMCELAVEGDDRLSVSRIEIERGGPSYTVDTLRALREQGGDDELFLILGADQASALPRWREPEDVLSLATVCVVERTGWSRHAVGVDIGRLRGADGVRFLHMPLIEISSTAIRRRAARGEAIRYLVPDKVASYIADRSLYGEASAAPAAAGTG